MCAYVCIRVSMCVRVYVCVCECVCVCVPVKEPTANPVTGQESVNTAVGRDGREIKPAMPVGLVLYVCVCVCLCVYVMTVITAICQKWTLTNWPAHIKTEDGG